MLTSGLKYFQQLTQACSPCRRNVREAPVSRAPSGGPADPVGLGPQLSKRGSRDSLSVPTAALGAQGR